MEQIPIEDNGEPLVDLRVCCPDIRVEAQYTFPRRPTLWGRAGVADRLNRAQALLTATQPGYRLLVVDAWRSLGRQRLYYRLALVRARLLYPRSPASHVRNIVSRYVAPPDDDVPPPHSTGGAVDVRLLGPDENPVIMGPRGLDYARTADDRLTPVEAQNRRILCTALTAAGFVNYEEEWWHWSYGDSIWALKSGQPKACYGSIRLQSSRL